VGILVMGEASGMVMGILHLAIWPPHFLRLMHIGAAGAGPYPTIAIESTDLCLPTSDAS
jgi:hypothetical protein